MKRGHSAGVLDRHAQRTDRRRVGAGRQRRRTEAQRHVVERRDLAGEAGDAERVGPVGGDLEVDDRVGAGRRPIRAGHGIERRDRGELEAGEVQPLGQRLDADRDVDQLTQPGHEHFHGVILATSNACSRHSPRGGAIARYWGNCSRNRTSFS